MAEEDVYGNKEKFERRVRDMPNWVDEPQRTRFANGSRFTRRYRVLNAANLAHWPALAMRLDARDISYVRRNRYLDVFLFLCAHTNMDLAMCEQADVDSVIASAHRTHRTRESKKSFLSIANLILDSIAPGKFKVHKRIHRSIERSSGCLSFDEVCQVVRFLRDQHLLRAYVTTILETFIRPQELSWRTMKDVEIVRRNGVPIYARIMVSSHGKEGTKPADIKSTLGYFMEWLNRHPHREDPDALLFPDARDLRSLLKPTSVTHRLQRVARLLGIKNRLCAYQLKTLGITFACQRYDDPKLIQAKAGWRSLKQLSTYDKSTSEQMLDADLVREGLLDESEVEDPVLRPKDCPCGEVVGFAEEHCPRCHRELTKDMIRMPPRRVA